MATLKVMTWNVENLFRPGPGTSRDAADGFRLKIALLADTIAGLAPDVIAFQELGGEDALRDLQDATAGSYPHLRVSGAPDGRGIRVGFLSRHAIIAAEDIVDFAPGPASFVVDLDNRGRIMPLTRMGRGGLRIRVAADGGTVDLITVHLKSKLLSFRRPFGTSFQPRDEEERAQVAAIALARRTAEAVSVRIRADALLKDNADTPLIVLGDLNDVPEAQTTQILLGPPGSEIGTGGFNRPDRGDDVRLFNLSPRIPDGRRFSRVHRGRQELLDQILVSEELLPPEPESGHRRLPEVDSHVDFADALASVGELPRDREIAPDHAPVTATFTLPGEP